RIIICFLLCLIMFSDLGGETKEKKRVVPESVRKKRFSNFSTAASFILVCIKEKGTDNKEMVVIENMSWYSYLFKEKIFTKKEHDEYVRFMMKHHTKCFAVSQDTFRVLTEYYRAPVRKEYEEIKKKGAGYVISKYCDRFYWNAPRNTGPYAYFIKKEYARDKSFQRMLLEMGLVVRRECESGAIFIEPEEAENQSLQH
ncbi:MAG: hypothetical protein JW827_11565, partial [Spirochaetes bacterium]|nr:hypothetical protein [Spirochaetota bacterium]